jgi:4-hydroxyproline epimerase
VINIVDSHTGGEPTRVVIDGGPDLGQGSMAEQRQVLQRDCKDFMSTVINEPRGSDVIVGALLCAPQKPQNTAGVIFFNNADCLWMCGHATIGLLVTLAYLKRIEPGIHIIETPVGEVQAELLDNHTVRLQNIPSYRYMKDFVLEVDGLGSVRGDIAWGGNWFFLINEHEQELNLKNLDSLMSYTRKIKQALTEQKITGDDFAPVDHVEIFSAADDEKADSKNFVLCPGNAYDRSPCGTGTSAKLSCLAADGKLATGEIWRQAGILNSIFEASYEIIDEQVIPSIKGSAYITAEANLICQHNDPFKSGICHD